MTEYSGSSIWYITQFIVLEISFNNDIIEFILFAELIMFFLHIFNNLNSEIT